MSSRSDSGAAQGYSRLDALRAAGVYLSAADAALERLARLAARVVPAPIAMLLLVDGEVIVSKGTFGLPDSAATDSIPFADSLCRSVVQRGVPLLIRDSHQWPSATDGSLAERLGLVACLAIPLRAATGEVLGGLLVLDREARAWSDDELDTAGDLAAAAVEELERRAEWQHSQDALRSREQRFRSLMESTADVVAVLASGGIIDYITPSVARVLGYEPEQLIGTNAFSLIHAGNAEEVLGRFAVLVRDGSCEGSLEFRVRHQNGTWRTLEARANNLLNDPVVAGVVVSSRDVTDERIAEQNQRRLNSFLEATPDFVATFDPHGRALSINQAFRRAVGLADEVDLATVDLTDLFPHHALEKILLEGIPTALREGTWLGETSLQGKDGREIPISQVILAHRSPSGAVEFLSTLGRDISERQQAEMALRRSEQHFRALIENSADIIAIVDAGGTIRYESPSVERALGYRPEELLGRPILELVHPDDRALAEARFRAKVANEADRGILRVRVSHKDGSWCDLEMTAENLLNDPAVAGIVINCRDITERMRAEEALRQSEARGRAIFDGAAIGIALFDMQGRLVQTNPALREMLGYSEAELSRRSLTEFTHPEDVPLSHSLFEELVRGQRDQYQVEKRYVRSDGRVVFARKTVSIIRSAASEAQLAVAMVEDVTEQRKTQEALIDSQRQLLQSQKMEAVGRLAGGIAHDFNNLLTAIKGFTELLLLDLEPHDPRRPFATEIQAAANRAAGLTRQLLAFSRKQVLQPKVLDLNASVADMQTMLRRLIGEDVELEVRSSSRGHVKADPGQIEQVLLNLAVNARDSMPSGGRLVIETADVELRDGELPRHWHVRPGEYVQLRVSDTGGGMSKEVQEHIFEPFFTTKEVGKGTGLGLSTVYGIIKQSGGYITVESELGRGSTFRVFLPRVEAVVEQRTPRAVDAGVSGHECVLVVEDEEAVRVLIRRVLSRNGYRVLEAESGAAALSLLERHNGAVDLLLTDVVMPGMSGRELADHLTGRFKDMRVLYMSGYTDEAIVHHGVLDPGVAFLEKPFTPGVLLRRLREVLNTPQPAAS